MRAMTATSDERRIVRVNRIAAPHGVHHGLHHAALSEGGATRD
jgi:hypothetical protein